MRIWVTRELTVEMVVGGYKNGIFPMAIDERDVFTWHRPDPRAILPLDRFHRSRSLRKVMRQGRFAITYDQAFGEVMAGCADRSEGTWINRRFHEVYGRLFQTRVAHSVEVWQDGALVGGTYGVSFGAAFMAESKFHRARDASKVALAGLVDRLNERGYELLDVQYLTPHLAQFGVVEIPALEYDRRLEKALAVDRSFA